MQRVLWMVISLTFVGFGCSSNAKKNSMDGAAAPSTDPKVLEKSTAKDLPAAEKGAPGGAIECSVKGDARTIEVREKGTGCEVIYTKGGKEGVVATAANGKSHCQATAEKIQNKLKGSGFDCK